MIKRKEKDSDQCKARHGYVGGQWVAQPAQTMFSSTEQGEERKTTLKMKPHRVRKPFQVAAGHSIKTITILQSMHMHQSNYTQHIAI